MGDGSKKISSSKSLSITKQYQTNLGFVRACLKKKL